MKENINIMEVRQKKFISDDLKRYDPLASEEDYIEVTEWENGEGYDISIYENSQLKHLSLSYNELDAINF